MPRGQGERCHRRPKRLSERFVTPSAIRTHPAMIRILGSCVALALIVFLAFPFVTDAYHRYEIGQRLKPLMDARDQAAWQAWSGDPAAFGRSLYERCELVNGPGSPACDPYKKAIE